MISSRCTIRLLYYFQKKKQIPQRVYKHTKRKTQIQYYYHQYTTSHYTYILHHEEFFKVNKYLSLYYQIAELDPFV